MDGAFSFSFSAMMVDFWTSVLFPLAVFALFFLAFALPRFAYDLFTAPLHLPFFRLPCHSLCDLGHPFA